MATGGRGGPNLIPSYWVPKHDSFTTAQQGSLPSIGDLPEVSDVNRMNMENYKPVVLPLTNHVQ